MTVILYLSTLFQSFFRKFQNVQKRFTHVESTSRRNCFCILGTALVLTTLLAALAAVLVYVWIHEKDLQDRLEGLENENIDLQEKLQNFQQNLTSLQAVQLDLKRFRPACNCSCVNNTTICK